MNESDVTSNAIVIFFWSKVCKQAVDDPYFLNPHLLCLSSHPLAYFGGPVQFSSSVALGM